LAEDPGELPAAEMLPVSGSLPDNSVPLQDEYGPGPVSAWCARCHDPDTRGPGTIEVAMRTAPYTCEIRGFDMTCTGCGDVRHVEVPSPAAIAAAVMAPLLAAQAERQLSVTEALAAGWCVAEFYDGDGCRARSYGEVQQVARERLLERLETCISIRLPGPVSP